MRQHNYEREVIKRKILVQDRTTVMEMSKEVWCAENGDLGALIVCDSKFHAQIAAYKDMARGKEVINEMFQYYRNGKNSYIMPIE